MQLRGALWVWLSVLLIPGGGAGGAAAAVQVVKIGAVLSFNSSIGAATLSSLKLAVQDVNANASFLQSFQLLLETADSACNAVQGAAAAVNLLKADVVAIAGPQSSGEALFLADLGAATNVPIVSFAATDPALTQVSTNPFFLRTVPSDAIAMQAIAAIIALYGWREVVAISTDDYLGLNSLAALSSALAPLDLALAESASIPVQISSPAMESLLSNLSLLQARVFVVHLQPSLARLLFSTAHSLSMLSAGYVWIVTEALSSALEDLPNSDPLWSWIQGVIGVRSYVPPSPALESVQKIVPTSSIFTLLAYDSVWMIARAVDEFLRGGGGFAFDSRAELGAGAGAGGGTDLESLGTLREGAAFLRAVKGTRFVGITGEIGVDGDGEVVGGVYEVVNLIGRSARVVGYWDGTAGFSRVPPVNSSVGGGGGNSSSKAQGNSSQAVAELEDVIWPGGSAQVPKGWAVVKDGQKLVIGVPRKTGFPQFVDIQTDPLTKSNSFHGFCIDVFEAAVSELPYSLNYTYVAYGNGTVTPSYDDLVQQVADNVFDAVVGDVTITTQRSKIVDFTQPYTASGLVVVVPTKSTASNQAWAFMRPFTPLMWCTTGLFFLFTGLTIWILEHKKNKDFRGRPKKQFVTVLWFIFSTLFFSQREKTKSTLGRAVLIIWLFVVLIVISSYTASLTSILTVQQLQPTVQGIAGLVASTLNIGYQDGSFVQDYLLQMNVPQDRLVALDNQTDFANALSKGVVGAIVDELPYIQVFLATECSYTIAGQEFTKSGWGFAFPKGSQLAVDMSTAILALSENGRLQQIHDSWLNNQGCSSSGLEVSSNQLGLRSFWGLFLITGAASILCVLVYYSRLIWQHHKTYRDDDTESDRSISRSDRRKSFLRSLVSYIEESEVAAARNDALGANNSNRKSGKNKKRSEFNVESEGSARSAVTTPEHPADHY